MTSLRSVLVAFAILAMTAIAIGRAPVDFQDSHTRPPGGDKFMARTFRTTAVTMPYRLFIPKNYDPKQRYPLLLWLHGAGGTGTDNAAQIAGDQTAGTQTWTTPDRQARHPAFVLAPQSADARWVTDRLKPDLPPILAAVIRATRNIRPVMASGGGCSTSRNSHPGCLLNVGSDFSNQ
jgi:poly(3-hydroxybutyrate) depolymerase